MTGPRQHELFKAYPLDGTAIIATGEVPTPYHIYDGYGLLIVGTCDAAAARRLLSTERVVPLQTAGGRALMGIWVCNFTDASLGPHHELQVSFFVTTGSTQPVPDHPLGVLELMLTRAGLQMLCFGLWNNRPEVVAYNRALLSLNASLVDSHIERRGQSVTFAFHAADTGKLVCSGTIADAQRPSARANLSLVGRVGPRRMMALLRQPWVSMRVLNPMGVVLDRHAAALTFTKNDTNALRYFDVRKDSLAFGDNPYRDLNFTPQAVQFMDGFKFVYLMPE